MLPLFSSFPLSDPMLGLVCIVQLKVSASWSCMVMLSVFSVCMQSPVLWFVGFSPCSVGQLLIFVVKWYVWLVQLHPSVRFTLQ